LQLRDDSPGLEPDYLHRAPHPPQVLFLAKHLVGKRAEPLGYRRPHRKARAGDRDRELCSGDPLAPIVGEACGSGGSGHGLTLSGEGEGMPRFPPAHKGYGSEATEAPTVGCWSANVVCCQMVCILCCEPM